MSEYNDLVAKILDRYRLGLCVQCGAVIQREQQVGRCVYNHPCGHRRGQGKARTQGDLNQCRLAREKHDQKTP